jgi:hypothetical protein
MEPGSNKPEDVAPAPRSQDAYWRSIQDENGVDLTLIESNLKLTPLERLRRGDAARRSALKLQEIGRRARERKEHT